MSLPGKIRRLCCWTRTAGIGCAFILTFIFAGRSAAQTGAADSIRTAVVSAIPDSTIARGVDSTIGAVRDSLAVDSAARVALEDSLGIRISHDALPSKVVATATDSAVLDLTTNKFYLYGDAQVEYEDLTLNAGRVTYEQSTGVVTAQPLTDTSLSASERPTFSQGEEKFHYDWLRYNFNSKRAIVRNARTQHGEGYVISEQVKRSPDQSIYGLRSTYTTCSLDTPHFGIRARRIKVIPGRIAVSGTANLEIERIPTPIYLPFAFFPVSTKQTSGFKLPSYTFETQRGLGLTNGGYYFHISDYLDLLVTGNIYSQGSFNTSVISTYATRYKFNGGVDFQYGYDKKGEVYEPGSSTNKSFAFRWRHTTDAKARPGLTFNANVNVVKNNYFQQFSYNPNLIVNNNFQSNVTLSRTWTTRPMGLTASLRHAQNTQTRLVNLTLPEFNFYYSQFSPFQRKNPVGAPKWYEKISTSYNFNALNQTDFYDSTLQIANLKALRFRNGFKHSIPISASYTALRFINLSFGTTYNEYWLTERQDLTYNEEARRPDTNFRNGFFTARDFNAGLTASTRIYGTKLFRKGRVAGIRHVLTPTVGFNYTPDFAAAPFRYAQLVQIDSGRAPQYISPFTSSIIGVPGSGQFGDFSSNITYGLGNNLQMKLRGKKNDTGVGPSRNISLIDGLSIGGSYNLSADSFRWSPLGIQFRTAIADRINVSASSVLDPYGLDLETGRRQRVTALERGAGIGRVSRTEISLSANFSSSQRTPGPERVAERTDEFTRLTRPGGYNEYVDFNVPWNVSFSYSLGVSNNYIATRRADTLVLGQFVQVQGDVNLTPRWKITASTGYDFTSKKLQITDISIYRDLHCWEMRLNTIPFGIQKSYTFSLSVKASVLQDLKLQRRRDFRDAVF